METSHPGLSPEQLAQYRAEGVVRLPGAVPLPHVEQMLAVVWRRLRTRHGIDRDRRESWYVPHPAQLGANNDDFVGMASPRVLAVLDQLLPGGWKPPARWGLPMVTLPGFSARWELPHKGWHLDMAATPEPPRMTRLFLLLAPSVPGGGGTGYVTGSHTVIRDLARETGQRLNSGDLRKLLAREPWFEALLSRRRSEDRIARFMQTAGRVGEAAVRVGEMTGDPGDVYVMDPLLLHATMPNAATTPRLMLMEGVSGDDS